MKLAIHLRGALQPPDIYEHLARLYGLDFSGIINASSKHRPMAVQRVYFGDEFCPQRLPSLSQFNALADLATAKRWQLTLLTPPLSDSGLEQCEPLLRRLQEYDSNCEVVVNDWGVAIFLLQNFPEFKTSLGRLLNKAFKDPRLDENDDIPHDVLNRYTFQGEDLQHHMQALGISAYERDLLPYETLPADRGLAANCAIYFPYGYITTGRVCWTATMGNAGCADFAVAQACKISCDRYCFELKHKRLSRKLIQNGNTIFYRYPPAMLQTLLETAQANDVRLIYQGLAL